MNTESNSQSMRFLILAMKASSGTISEDERKELRMLTRQNKALEHELCILQVEGHRDSKVEFTVLLLRVLLGSASSKEATELMNLAKTNPEKWVAFQDLRFALEEFVHGPPPSATQLDACDPSIDRIRERVLSQLKSSKT